MREIKFRAWDEKEKVMYSPEKMGRDELTINPDGRGFVNVHGGSTKFSRYYSHILPMQYTGLKDKNGKEIYEGDIIKSIESYPFEVFWMGLAWGVKWNDLGNSEESIICDDQGDMTMEGNKLIYMKIVGNIYENPELLKKEDEKKEKEVKKKK